MTFIVKGTILLVTIFCTFSVGAAQDKLRRVDQPALYQYKNMPVAVDVKFDDREMVERKAIAGPDWLKRLSLDVANTSGKNIKALSIQLILRDAQSSPGLTSIVVSLRLANSEPRTTILLPGSRTTLRPVASHIDRYLGLLKEQGTADLDKVILDVHDVEFTDGTRWLIGDLLRLDPDSGQYKKVNESVMNDELATVSTFLKERMDGFFLNSIARIASI